VRLRLLTKLICHKRSGLFYGAAKILGKYLWNRSTSFCRSRTAINCIIGLFWKTQACDFFCFLPYTCNFSSALWHWSLAFYQKQLRRGWNLINLKIRLFSKFWNQLLFHAGPSWTKIKHIFTQTIPSKIDMGLGYSSIVRLNLDV